MFYLLTWNPHGCLIGKKNYQAFLNQDINCSPLPKISGHRLNQELPLFLFLCLGVATLFIVCISEKLTIYNGVAPVAFFVIWFLLWRTRNFTNFRKKLYERWHDTLNGSTPTRKQCERVVSLCQELSNKTKTINKFNYDQEFKQIEIGVEQDNEIYIINQNGDVKNTHGE